MSRKMRPYTEPPKVRRSFIPGEPGSAATGFLVVAVLWLAVATGIALLAIGLRIVQGIEISVPLGLFGLSFELDARRVEHAFVNASVYGWLANAGIGAILFVTPRLVGRPLAMEMGANVALGIWNLAVAGGIASLYLFELGPHYPLTSFPFWVEGGMALALLILLGSFVPTAAAGIRSGYISLWYFAAALPALLALVAASAVISFLELPEATVALASGYLGRSIEVFWLVGIAVGVIYYVIPRTTGNPLASAGLAMLGWLVWLVLAGLSGLAQLVDTTVPYAVTTVGSVATLLLLLHAFLVVANLVMTMQGRWTMLFGVGVVPFAMVSLVFLFSTALLEGVGGLRTVASLVGGTEWQAGAFVYAALGTSTFAMFALAEHALPRLLRREWGGGILPGTQLWAGFGGATIAGLALMGAGLAEGSLLAQAATAETIAADLMPYRVTAAGGLGLLALAGLALLVNLFLMYTSGRPAEYVMPGQAASTASAGH